MEQTVVSIRRLHFVQARCGDLQYIHLYVSYTPFLSPSMVDVPWTNFGITGGRSCEHLYKIVASSIVALVLVSRLSDSVTL